MCVCVCVCMYVYVYIYIYPSIHCKQSRVFLDRMRHGISTLTAHCTRHGLHCMYSRADPPHCHGIPTLSPHCMRHGTPALSLECMCHGISTL